MKLHRDGTLEGTPTEIAQYNKLTEKKDLYKVIQPKGLEEYPGTVPNPLYHNIIVSGTIDMRDLEPMPALKLSDYSSPARYVHGLMSAINNKGYLH